MTSLGNGNHPNEPDGETTPNPSFYRQENWFVDALDAFSLANQWPQTRTTDSAGSIPSAFTLH